ncbi:MAG: peroxide stress protein YaaA [Fluviicola sp.]
MKVLLSPAKAIDMSKRLQTEQVQEPMFINEAEGLMKKMRKFSANKIGKMMHLSKELAELNYERNQSWDTTATITEETGHAMAIFNGEVYRGLDALTLDEKGIQVAQEKIRILSGLYGLLRPLDVVHPYRLEMGTSWAVTAAKKNLYQFWGSKICDALNEEESDVIVNCASAEYFKAAQLKNVKAKVITPVFKDLKNGDYKVIMVYAKQSRGAMARYIVDHNIEDPEEIKGFNIGGYQFDTNLSTETEFVFTR